MQNKSNSIEAVLADLVQKYGGAELYKKENARKLNGLLKDMAGDFPDELRLLTRVVPEGFQEILYKADKSSAEERKGALAECKIRFVDEIFLQKEKAEEVVNILAAGLGWTIKLEEDSKSSSNSINDETFADTTDYSDDFLRNLTIIQLLALENKTHNAKVQFMLGWRYAEGKIVDQDYEKSNEWYRKASEHAEAFVQKKQENTEPVHKTSEEPVINIDEYDDDYLENLSLKELLDLEHKTHNAKIQNYIGLFYDDTKYGPDVPVDLEKAVKWYQKAAEQGFARAQCNLAYMYKNGEGIEKNYVKAVEWYRKAADQGYARAQNNLGDMYYYAYGVEKNYTKAVELYCKAADQGYASAQCNLGYMYRDGKGVITDYTKSVEWYCKAAEQGNENAMDSLGHMYYWGKGVEKDYEKSFKWYLRLADKGNVKAQVQIGDMYKYGYGVEKDYVKTVEWYRKAADKGYSEAQIALAEMYRLGDGVSRDYQKMFEWFQKAAEQGDVSAQRDIAAAYSGYDVSDDDYIDYQKSFYWYKKAADQGDSFGQYRVGSMYENGEGVSQSYQKAVEWYQKAIEHEFDEYHDDDVGRRCAEEAIGRLYEKGCGVPQNYHKALELYQLAVKHGRWEAESCIKRVKQLI